MSAETIIPEAFQKAFNQYSKLQTIAEKDQFWKDLANSGEFSQAAHGQLFKDALMRLSAAVGNFQEEVRQKLPA